MLFRTDRLFAEAARSPEHCDKLLKRLQRARAWLLVIFILIACLAAAGLCYEFSRIMRFLDAIVISPPGSKTPDPPQLSLIALLSTMAMLTLPFEWATILHADACVKMLLILQQQQARPADPDSPGK